MEREGPRVLKARKYCPKCGSMNVNFLAFCRPSIWKCLDCGYEGAFIIEDSKIAEKLQKRYRQVRDEEIRKAINARLKECLNEVFLEHQGFSPLSSYIETTWD